MAKSPAKTALLDATQYPWASKLPPERLIELYRYMATIRAFEERIVTLYRQGKIVGGAYLSRGQEAISIGAAYALEKQDVLVPLLRDLGSHLVKGQTVRNLYGSFLNREYAPSHGRDGNVHLGDWSLQIPGMPSHLAIQIPLTAGIALASKLRGSGIVALNFIGNGGCNVGDFHEGLNFAAVLDLPMVLIIENNQYAYSTPNSSETRLEHLSDRAEAYGIPGFTVDGTDVLAVYEATKTAIERARSGAGPTLLEMNCMRMRGHAEHDDAFYVPKELLAEWRKKDPLERYVARLAELGVMDESAKTAIDERIAAEIAEAERFASEAPMPVGGEQEIRDVYAG